MKRRRSLALAVIASALLTIGVAASPTPPAGANPAYTPLAGNTYSPRYVANTCRYRIIYLNYGSTPVANVRLYGPTCTGVSVGVAGQNGATTTWTWNPAAPTPWGTDACGSYSLLQVVGSVPGIAVGASVIASGAWHAFRHDGTGPPPPTAPC